MYVSPSPTSSTATTLACKRSVSDSEITRFGCCSPTGPESLQCSCHQAQPIENCSLPTRHRHLVDARLLDPGILGGNTITPILDFPMLTSEIQCGSKLNYTHIIHNLHSSNKAYSHGSAHSTITSQNPRILVQTRARQLWCYTQGCRNSCRRCHSIKGRILQHRQPNARSSNQPAPEYPTPFQCPLRFITARYTLRHLRCQTQQQRRFICSQPTSGSFRRSRQQPHLSHGT